MCVAAECPIASKPEAGMDSPVSCVSVGHPYLALGFWSHAKKSFLHLSRITFWYQEVGNTANLKMFPKKGKSNPTQNLTLHRVRVLMVLFLIVWQKLRWKIAESAGVLDFKVTEK